MTPTRYGMKWTFTSLQAIEPGRITLSPSPMFRRAF
jgi:hypothetical protein